MSNLEIIERLCEICEMQNDIIKSQSSTLEQLDAAVEQDKIEEARELYDRFFGDIEF